MPNQNDHIQNKKNLKQKVQYGFLKTCTSNSAVDISLREMNNSHDGKKKPKHQQPNTLSTPVFSPVTECCLLSLT